MIDLGLFRRFKKIKKCLSHIGFCVKAVLLAHRRTVHTHILRRGCMMALWVTLLLLCGGDQSIDAHGVDLQPPVSPPVTAETERDPTERETLGSTETMPEAERETDAVTEAETRHAVADTHRAETESTEVMKEPTDPAAPIVSVSEAQRVEDEGYLYTVEISNIGDEGVCGLLFILHTEADCEIFAVTGGGELSGLHFSYIINKNTAVALMDGKKYIPSKQPSVLCYVAVRSMSESPPKLMINIVEYA